MTINRHPLQSIGVGQNSRMLPDEAVVPYCDALGERLGWLANALGEERKEGDFFHGVVIVFGKLAA